MNEVKLKQDINDLLDLTDARRCKKCNRYYLVGYICNHCKQDNSIDNYENEEEDPEL